jgi:hypothetical protein
LNSNNNKTTFKKICGCLGIGLCNILWFFFWKFDPLYFEGHNFLDSIAFLTIFRALNVLIGWIKFLFKHKKLWNPSLGFGLPWTLKCYICNLIATNEQLKDLTHMFYLQIPCYKVYKEGLFSYVLALKYMCHFGLSLKKFNLKAKHKIKNKILWLFFSALSFVLFYLLTYLGK